MPYLVTILRITGFLEGVSFILLLFIAMPLKYLADLPVAVKVCGLLHGILFVLYLGCVAVVSITYRWSLLQMAEASFAALYPFGTFIYDAKLRRLNSPEKKQPDSA